MAPAEKHLSPENFTDKVDLMLRIIGMIKLAGRHQTKNEP